MKSIRETFQGARRDPVYTIGVILAVGLIMFAIYFIGPWYVGGPTTAIGLVFDNPITRAVLGVIYLVPSIAVLVGAKGGRKYRRFGTFGMSLCFLFITMLRLVTIGFVPAIWIFVLVCTLISSLVYLYVSINEEDKT
jgi:hypothetical protein